MPTIEFTVRTSLPPEEVLALLTDFGPDRAKNWPNTTESHYRVHQSGEGWAEVTEGMGVGWERERYEWDAGAGTVTIETLDSNLWAPGSGWRYQLTPAGEGTDVHVSLHRIPGSVKGRIVGALIPVAGAPTLGKQLRSVLRKAERR